MFQIFTRLFSKSSSDHVTINQSTTMQETYITEAPFQYRDCTRYEEKLIWIESTRGQNKLALLPVILEFYRNGRLFKLMKNKHWDIRLNEWFFIETNIDDDNNTNNSTAINNKIKKDSIPFGLSLPIPKELQPRKNRPMHEPHENPPIWDMYESNPNFLMPMIYPLANKYDILTTGYTTFHNIIPSDILDKANIAISNMIVSTEVFNMSLKERADYAKKNNLDSFFTEGGTNNRDVLALYYCSPIYALVEALLHNENHSRAAINSSRYTFQPRTGGAQVAFRFSQAGHSSRAKIGGRSWHIDGMDRGTYGAFSLLIGVALSDQLVDYCGNLCLHAGSHHALKHYMKTYAAACDDSLIDTADEMTVQDHRMKAVSILRTTKPILEEPEQMKLQKGDVVFVMHKVAHLGGPNYSQDIRKMIYFRVSHRNLPKIRDAALEDLWIEYEGMQEVLE